MGSLGLVRYYLGLVRGFNGLGKGQSQTHVQKLGVLPRKTFSPEDFFAEEHARGSASSDKIVACTMQSIYQ